MKPRILKAMNREPVDCTPVWFMRQAGRYQAAYQTIRKKHTLLEICRNPEVAAEVTLLPIRQFPGLDAAILFSDLLPILIPMGLELEYLQGEGPHIRNPVQNAADVAALKPVEIERDLPAVPATIQIVTKELPEMTPLIGFGGAPFTLASYAIEGGPSKNYLKTKSMMWKEPALWNQLLTKLSDAVIALLRAQVKAGARAIQIFDSWVGALGTDDYRDHVLPHSKRIFDALGDLEVPLIHFGTGTSGLLELMKEAGGNVIGIDWRIPLDAAWKRMGDVAVQGNLDPATLVGPREVLLRRVDEILERAANRNGHIFNLGHGILPETPPENVAAVIEHVHQRSAR